MRPQLLDTHILEWYLTGDTSLHASIRSDIDKFPHRSRVSMESLKELMLLRELGEVASYLTVDYVCSRLDELNMIIEPVKLEHVYYMGYLSPVTDEHGHPLGDFVDRILVSQSISKRYTLVSGDHFFSLYSDQGLEVLNGRTAERTKGQEVNRSDPAIFPPEYLPKLSPGWLVRLSR